MHKTSVCICYCMYISCSLAYLGVQLFGASSISCVQVLQSSILFAFNEYVCIYGELINYRIWSILNASPLKGVLLELGIRVCVCVYRVNIGCMQLRIHKIIIKNIDSKCMFLKRR